MKKLGRSHDDRTDHLHDIDSSLCFGPSHVTVACEYFCNAAQMTLKGSHLLIETGIDMVGRNGASQATSITYLIELEDIIDVHKIVAEVDEKQQDIQDGIVVLLSDQKACLISAIHQPLCLKVLINSWQTHLMRCAARLHRPHALAAGSDGVSVTREYYAHFILALRTSASVDDFISLLTEYGKEVMSNQTLKLITFETKELLTIAVQVWNTLLLRVPVWKGFEEDAKWKQLAPTDTKKRAVLYSVIKSANSNSIDSQILQDEYNQYLLTIVGNRLAILSVLLQTLVAIFFGSELISDRVDSVTSDSVDSVLGLSSWLTLLCTDTLLVIAEAIGLSDDVLQAQIQKVAEPLGASFQTPRQSLLSMMAGGGGSFRVSPFTPSKLPMKAMATDKNAIEAMPLLYKDVKHRQSLILFEVLRIVDNERSFFLSFSNISRNNSLYALPDYLINYSHVDDIEVQRMRLLVREGKQQVSARKQAKLFTALKLNCVSDYIGQVRDWDGMLDMWVGALLDSLDQLLSSQNIRLHNGVAVHAPSLAVSRAPSFRSVDTSYSNTSAYDGRENRLCYPMVRIFYLLHILHYLAMDSSHVREVLSKELVSHWSSVMSIFQIICPHQSMNVKVAQNDCLNSARKPSFQRQESISSSAPNSVRLSGREVFIKDSPFRKLSRSESRRSILTNVLASSMSRMLSTRGSFKQPNVPSLNFSSIIEEAPVANEPIIDNTRSSTAFSCGALPRHGLSVAAWRLLVICRLRCEALIFDVLKIPESSILASKESILPEPSAEGDGDDELLMNLPPIHPAKLKRTGLQVSTADNGGTDIDTAVNTLSGSIAAITSPSAAEGRKSARFIVPDDERRGSLNESEKQLPSPIYSESPSATRKRVRMFKMMIGLKRQKTFDIVPEHLISVRGLSMAFISLLLDMADEMKTLVTSQGGDDRLKHKVLATVFYEPSTRTSCSFQAAMLRLGGNVITLNEDSSSVKKGESLEDTIQTMSCYCDLIVLRHPAQGSAALAASVSTKSVVNAGDGTGEHPTQALLDIYTIKSELGYLGGSSADQPMVITFLGDLKHGRTVHSLALLVAMYSHVKLIYVHPPSLPPPEGLIQEVRERGAIQLMDMSIEDAIPITDVLYVTRIQKERFVSSEGKGGGTEADYERVAGSYVVNTRLMQLAKRNMVVMHPLPRLTEIDRAVDLDPRAAYFRQMENGMYVRMALLSMMMCR